MLGIFKKYHITVSAFKKLPTGINLITDVYFLDNNGRLSQEKPMEIHAKKFSYFKGKKKVSVIKGLYDESKWIISFTPVGTADSVK
jgi:hypothetical protein